MSLDFYWTLSATAPADRRRAEWTADDRPWAPPEDARSRRLQINRYDYLAQVARAAELTGFDGIVIPDDPDGEESWIVTGALIRETRRLRLVTGVAPGSASAVYHGKMASSVQRFSGDRQSWLIDLSATRADRTRQGDGLAQSDVDDRAHELIALTDGIWGDGPFELDGRHFVVEKGGLGDLVRGRTRPPLWLRQHDTLSPDLLAQADVVLLAGVPAPALADAIADARARHGGRSIRIAADIPLLTRAETRDIDAERARLSPPPHALVGTFDDVAAQLTQLAGLGLDIALLSATDQIREVHIAGEQIIARVRRQQGAARAAA